MSILNNFKTINKYAASYRENDGLVENCCRF